MMISVGQLALILAGLLDIIALYYIIKKVGAKDMETKKEIDALKKDVSTLEQKAAIAETCNTKNDKAIGEMQRDIDWIKKGIDEIKAMLQAKE